MSPPTGGAPTSGAARPSDTFVLLVLATAALAYSIMQTMVLPAIPALGEELHAGPTGITWVVSAFFISSAVSIPVVGRLGDAHGRVRVLIGAMSVFAVGTLAAALAPGLETLVAARVLQGVGAAVFPLSYALVGELLSEERRSAGMGTISATFGAGSGIGYVAGGPLLQAFGWRGLFVAGLVPAVLTVVLLPRLPRSEGSARLPMDWVGAGVLSAALAALLVAIGEGGHWGWGGAPTVGLFVVAAVGLVAWVVVERGRAAPMIDMRVFLRPSMVLVNVSAMLVGYAFFSLFVLIPGFVSADPGRLGYGFGTADDHIGLFFLPYAIAMIVGGAIAGRAGGPRQLLVLRGAIVVIVAGLLVLAATPGDAWLVYAAVGVVGVGCGACLTALAQLVIDAVRSDESAVATGMNTMCRMVGMAIAAQTSAAVVASQLGPAGADVTGYAVGFVLAAVAGVLSLLATATLGRPQSAAAPGPAAA